ncbi:Uncharacterized protein PECH_006609 [Penicillium ucsense]|uniref:FAD dependent oxidoreductase domain-containing protein n=1 Tax=Penicillium ucsense TaxID=2839758 RepID=A0A8J8W3S5_9EURO|nr:Uncharacterized protein PECM_004024 [Penicillium ucsense]KAF7735504.1 Uncharacterized protein PECH_006609 [Penicillium ucsense]
MIHPDNGSSRNLPNNTPCLSYWQRTTRAFPYLAAHHNDPVPTCTQYVVIGSGISGGLTAFELIEAGVAGQDIVILEAREAASGASSRNAGHVRPDAFRGFSAYARVHGPEQALRIISDERRVLDKVNEFVAQHGVQCDFQLTSTFDVCMTPEFADYEAESFQQFKAAGGDVSHIRRYEGAEAQAKTRIPDAIAAYEWPAGSSHPAKLAQFLLESVIERGVRLFTFCPATEIVRSPDGFSWDIHTPRGAICAKRVVHCTNAHAALLLPQLELYLRPNRAQAHSLIPTVAFTANNALRQTFSLRYSLHHFYSLIQRQGDGTLILGVSRSNPTLSAETLASRYSIDDSHFNNEIVQDALSSFKNIFPNFSQSARDIHGEGLDHAWSGIIAMTTDSVPFVGAIDALPGQYICAGFNGHGMARIFTCAPGVVKLMLGGQWSDTGLPECFQFTPERLARLSCGDIPSIW